MMASNPYHSQPPPPACPSKTSGMSQSMNMNLTRSTINARIQTNSGNDGHDNFTAHCRRQRCPDDDDRSHVSQPDNLNDFNCNRVKRNQEQSSDRFNQTNFQNPRNGRHYGGVRSWESYEQDEKNIDFNKNRKKWNDRGDNGRIPNTGNTSRGENRNDKSANFDPNDPNKQDCLNFGSFTDGNDRADTIENFPGKRSHSNSTNQSGSNGNTGANHSGTNVSQTNHYNSRNNNLQAQPGNFHSRKNDSGNSGHQDSPNCNLSHNSFNNQTPHNSITPRNHNSSKSTHVFQVLYTHQKTKKKKSWKDGRLVLHNTRASLYEAVPIPGSAGGTIDSLDLTTNEARCLRDGCYDGELESEKFLITVEGPWNAVGGGSDGSGDGTSNDGNDCNNPLWNNPTSQSMKRQLQQRQLLRQRQEPSASMKKLLSNKFRIPQKIIPLHPEEKRRREAMNGGGGSGGGRTMKRSRPLQPGELERRFYGDGSGFYGHCGQYDDARSGRNGGGGYGSERRYDNNLRCRTNMQQERFETNHNAYTHDEAEVVRHNSQEFRCNDQERSYDGGYQQHRVVAYDRAVNDPKRIRRMDEKPDSKSSYHQWDCGDPPEYAGENDNNENQGPSNWHDSGKNDQFDNVNDYQGSEGTSQHFRSQENIGRGFHGPSEFVSDGFDPRDLYGEEDEEGDECSANEDDKGEDEVRDSHYKNHQANDCSDYASTKLPQSHGQNYSATHSTLPKHAIQHQVPTTASRNFYSTSQEVEKETEELLALFDDNPSQDVSRSDSQKDVSTTESIKQRDDRKHNSDRDGFQNESLRHADDNNHAQPDLFIASIRQADEQEDDTCDGWESKFSSIHGGFERGNDDDTRSSYDEDGDSCADKNETNGSIDKLVSGFSLPSPGESSSEGDETESE